MSTIADNLQAVNKRIADAAHTVSRDPHEVVLLAVSKTFGPDAVIDAARAGQRAFGENYVQEALNKIHALHSTLPDVKLEWHFIGPIQSNKTRSIAENFDWVHSVDREKIALRLSEQRPAHLPPLNVCVQVNVSGEASKSGVSAEEAIRIAHAITVMPRLRLRGLMAIPEPTEDVKLQRAAFHALRDLFEKLRVQGLIIDTLSMGMSADLEAAIAEGTTLVRVGTAIFGVRSRAP
ncbi:MAG: YggS family pyridoxal phosphate-dependent enzyme [Burkholderiales bacterium]|nr:YggS family pyridoxal phosphate-dependent enzyme [Burkholderiales bacterium]